MRDLLGRGVDQAANQARVRLQQLDLVINEVDYDQPGDDHSEFVEIKNNGASDIDLSTTGLVLVLFNGHAEAPGPYQEVELLSGTIEAGGYAVVASPNVSIPMGVPVFRFTDEHGVVRDTHIIQNGEPDGVALYDHTLYDARDALSYEGSMLSVSFDHNIFSLVEGYPTQIYDGGDGSMCRSPDGYDSDDAEIDWSFCATPTPGSMNSL